MNVFNHKRPLRRDNYDLAAALLEFLDRMKVEKKEAAAPCTPEQFALLLTGPAALRKVPGTPGPWVRKSCFSAAGMAATPPAVREHCSKLYGADDAQGLAAFAEKEYNTQNDYTQFRSFWKGRPCFDVNALDERGRFLFNACKDFAELLAPIAGRKGFFAFDCAERWACGGQRPRLGIITEEEFWQKARPAGLRRFRPVRQLSGIRGGLPVRRLLRHVPGPDGRGKQGGQGRDAPVRGAELPGCWSSCSPAPGRLPPGTSARPSSIS